MATFNLIVGGPLGFETSRKADGIVEMGKLVNFGASAGDVTETGTADELAWAVSLVDEKIARKNEVSDVSQFQYEDNDPCRVMTLVDGMVLNLEAIAAISEGDSVTTGTDGNVITATTDQIAIGQALAAITNGSRGNIVINRHVAE